MLLSIREGSGCTAVSTGKGITGEAKSQFGGRWEGFRSRARVDQLRIENGSSSPSFEGTR